MHSNVLTIILAGGKGTRLEPLTRDRAKPAVPFGGVYRIIDFTLSNCINSGLRRILVLTQYKANSLNRHIEQGWSFLSRQLDEYIEVLPPVQRIDANWYQGTADAIYQNIYSIEKAGRPPISLILGGDHIYKMNYAKMIASHQERNADLTVACLPVPRMSAQDFGVMQIDREERIIGFQEKPSDPRPMPDQPDQALASMGIYVFRTEVMFDQLLKDAANRDSSQRDFGRNIIPTMIGTHRIFAYPFRDENGKSSAYWRDVGALDAYFQANMDLVSVDPVLNLYDRAWPIHTYQPIEPPPKFVHHETHRQGIALDSLVCSGCIISGGRVINSILSPRVRINSYANVEHSILLEGVSVGRHAKIRRAIIDKDVIVPEGFAIGYDHGLDHSRGLTISEDGIVVVPKGMDLQRFANA